MPKTVYFEVTMSESDLSPIVFSKDVRDRLEELHDTVFLIACRNPYSAVLSAIEQSGVFLRIADNYQKYADLQKAEGALKVEIEIQSRLHKAGIVDDATAMAFIDRIESQLKAWSTQVEEMKSRHQKELNELIQGFQD